MNTTRQIRLIITSAAILALTAGSLARADEIYSGGVTVDINRDVLGYLWIEDATVNLLENAHIKNNGYYGDVYVTSGGVLNIYGGIIDGYLYVTTSYNGLPEAQVTVYGSNFAVNGAPVTEGTPEVFLQNSLLSGTYQNGMPFSHWIDCFWEGDFYLTVKLGWITSKPEIAASPMYLDFGQVKVGSTAEQTIMITNDGTSNLSLQSLTFVQGSDPGFHYTPLAQLPVTIEPGSAVSVNILFSPVMEGQALGVLKIASDDADTPYTDVMMTGVGIIPDIAVEPGSMNFGQMDIGTTASETLTITNHGIAELVVESINWAAGSSSDFAMAALPEFPLTIEPNTLVQLEIVYTPAVEGPAAATLEIASDDPDQPLVILAVTGEAIAPVVTPQEQIRSIIDFYNASVENGTIQGVGKGKAAWAHIKDVRKSLLMVKFLIDHRHKRAAMAILHELDKFTDGKPRPHDWVAGSAVAQLNADIKSLIIALKTK